MKTAREVLLELIPEDWAEHLMAEACGPGKRRYSGSDDECSPFGDIEGAHWYCGVWRDHEDLEHRIRIGEAEYQRRIRRWIK